MPISNLKTNHYMTPAWYCISAFSVMVLFLLSNEAVLFSLVIIALLFLFRKIEFGLFTLILFAPINILFFRINNLKNYMPYYLVEFNYLDFFQVLLVLILIIWLFNSRIRLIHSGLNISKEISFFLMALLYWTAFTIAWTPNTLNGLFHFVKFIECIALYYIFLAATSSNKKILHLSAICWIIIGVAWGIGAIISRIYVQYNPVLTTTTFTLLTIKLTDIIDIFSRVRVYPLRATSFGIHNYTSLILNMTIALLYYYIFVQHRVKKTFFIISLFIVILANILTTSKAGFGSFFIMTLFFFTTYKPIKKKTIANLIIVFGILISAFLVSVNYLGKTDTSRISSTSNMESKSSLSVRLDWWKKATKINIKDTGGMGLGVGGFTYYFSKKLIPNSHNFILSFFFDFGILGFLFISAIIFIVLREFIRLSKMKGTDTQKLAFAFASGLVAFSIHSLVDFTYNAPAFWMYLGMAMGAVHIAKQESLKEHMIKLDVP